MAAYESHGESDEWYTPRYIFDALGERFDLDVACPSGGPRHVPTMAFLTEVEDGLVQPWNGFIWMNQMLQVGSGCACAACSKNIAISATMALQEAVERRSRTREKGTHLH